MEREQILNRTIATRHESAERERSEHWQGKGKRVGGIWGLDRVVDARGRNPLAAEEAVKADETNAD